MFCIIYLRQYLVFSLILQSSLYTDELNVFCVCVVVCGVYKNEQSDINRFHISMH